MKVVLIGLPHPYLKQPDAQAPLGLLYLAAVLEKAGVEVEVKNYSSYMIDKAIDDLPRADLYGITSTSMELPQANGFAKDIKKKYPGSKVALGGPGAITDEYVDWSRIDAICKGEGELAILGMIDDMENGGLRKVYRGESISNLDGLPLPARHLLGKAQGGNIFAYDRNYKEGGSVTILTSRGCPYKCAFCSAPRLSRRVRFRSPESVFYEMSQVVEEFGIKQFRVSDDMFTANKEHALGICELVKKLDIAWRISIRAKPLSMDVLKALYDSGCKEVSIGIESFDHNVLNILRKGTTPEDNARALEMCEKIGIKTRVLFMIRTPGQTVFTVPRNIAWLNEVPYDIICCTTFVPLPGSDIWNNPDKYNIEILSRNLDDYNFYFFNADGENELKDIIKIKDRSLEEFNEESLQFKEYLKNTGKLNQG